MEPAAPMPLATAQPLVKPTRGQRDAEKMELLVQALIGDATLKDAIKASFKDGRKLHEALKNNPALRTTYDVAMVTKADRIAHEILEIADGEPDPQRARNRIDARKWLAARLFPKRYGDRLELTVQNEISITTALAEAHSRVARIGARAVAQVDEAEVDEAEVIEQPVECSLPAQRWPDIFN